MHTRDEFKYAALLDPQTGEFCTDASKDGLVMAPETAKRFEENTDGIAVTVCCITYKHEDLIRTALDSFLMQKTNFKFQVFVGEDCGPDGTADVIREYAEKYPDIIVPFIREKNMGAQRNLIDLCNRAKSPYIAFCEGDDYWIDEYKLQKQYDYMQSHEDVRICFSKAEISAPDDWFLRDWFKQNREGKMIFPDCEPLYKPTKKGLFESSNCVWVFPAHTATVFYRWNYDINIPDWYYTGLIGDHPLFLMQLGEGKAKLLDDVTAVYRRSNVGVYMSESMDEHFMKTRLDHVRWISGMLDWYEDNIQNYPRVILNNRIKLESFNYLKTAIKLHENKAIEQYFAEYPKAAVTSLNAYLSFFGDSRTLIRTLRWEGYSLLLSHRSFRLPLFFYGRFLAFLNRINKGIIAILKGLRGILIWLCYWLFALVPKDKNLWSITSFQGKGYLDNSKYFYEYTVKHHPEIKLIWLTKDDEVYEQLKSENKPVKKFGTLSALITLARSAIAVTDHYAMSDFSSLHGYNRRTKIVQLWHGVGFKAMGDGKEVKTVNWKGVVYSTDILPQPDDSIIVRLIKKIKFFFVAPHREVFEKYFLMICPGRERLEMIADVWNIPRENCFMAGHPRDINSHTLKADPLHPKVLYAPTFRYDPQKEVDLIDGCIDAFPLIQQSMEKIDGTFVLRLHPHTWRDYSARIVSNMKNFDRIVLDEEKDIYTSLGTYNVIISDYSSISLDFALLGRPAIYFCPDIVWFKAKQAGFNLDFESSIPGPLLNSWEEVIKKSEEYVRNPDLDSEMRNERIKYFFDKDANGPDNSERIVEEIKRRLNI